MSENARRRHPRDTPTLLVIILKNVWYVVLTLDLERCMKQKEEYFSRWCSEISAYHYGEKAVYFHLENVSR